MKKGQILLLNGPSSAGKTTLAWELQTNAPGYWYWLPLDCFFDAVPSRLWDENEDEGFTAAFALYHDCVKLISDQGKDIIMDTVICNKGSFASFETRLAGYPVAMVKVTCPVEELERRELERGDREIGLAAGQAGIMVPQKSYDLVVDTHEQSPAECAELVMGMLANPKKPPSAFAALTANPGRWANAASQSEML